MLLSGQLELWIGRKKYLLKRGDSFHFLGTTPHRFRNPTEKETRLRMALTPVS